MKLQKDALDTTLSIASYQTLNMVSSHLFYSYRDSKFLRLDTIPTVRQAANVFFFFFCDK